MESPSWSAGLTGRLCIVAETAYDLQLRDGGMEGSVAREVYGADRSPAPSIRTLSMEKGGRLFSKLAYPKMVGLKWEILLQMDDLRVPLL